MKLLVQPRDGLAPLLAAIRTARRSIEIAVFRFNSRELERALHAAMVRGVTVHALIANLNQNGTGRLRKLEQRLLGAGATVDRTGDQFVRYHGKFMIVDRSTLFVLGFNLTVLDMIRSRSFGVMTRNRKTIQDAVALFEADCARLSYEAGGALLVSPENARTQLAAFIAKARIQLLIYDPKISDIRMIALLKARVRAGVDVRILGKVGARASELAHQKYPGHRLHVRAIVRDGTRAFVGSQSLRGPELDTRREVGLFVRDAAIVKELRATFESDWALTALGEASAAAVTESGAVVSA